MIEGAAWLSISGISRRINSLEKVVLAAGLGLGSAIIAGTMTLLAKVPFDSSVDVFFVLTVGLLVIWLTKQPKLTLSRPKMAILREYWLPLGLFCFHVLLWTVYFVVYPYFPNSDAIDAVWHSDITNQVLHGTIGGPVASAGFPAGAHILFAFVSQYLGLDVLPSLRLTAAAIESLSVIVSWSLFRRVLPSKLVADYATVAYALLIPSGFIYYAKLGAYPNIIGDFFVVTSMLIAAIVMEKTTTRPVVTAAIIQGVALFSHISVIIFAGLVMVFSLVIWIRYRSKFRAYFLSNLGFFVLPIVGLVFASSTLKSQLTYILTLYLDLNNNVGLVLQQWSHNYLLFAGPVGFLLLIAATIWVMGRLGKHLWPLFFATWFTLLFLMVFATTNDWRLVLLSMVPGAGLLGLLLSKLQVTIETSFSHYLTPLRIGKKAMTVLMLLLVLVIAVQGPTAFVVNQDLASDQTSVQSHIYDSMTWIQSHTPPDSAVVSVALQREYRYLPFIANRIYRGDFSLDSEGILKLEAKFTFNFVVVSTRFDGLNTFYGSNAFKALHQNPDVIVFFVVKSS